MLTLSWVFGPFYLKSRKLSDLFPAVTTTNVKSNFRKNREKRHFFRAPRTASNPNLSCNISNYNFILTVIFDADVI